MTRSAGVLIIVIGVLVVIVGLLAATGALGWFGRLPGDIRYQRGGTSVFIPITSMILVSIGLTLLLALLRRVL